MKKLIVTLLLTGIFALSISLHGEPGKSKDKGSEEKGGTRLYVYNGIGANIVVRATESEDGKKIDNLGYIDTKYHSERFIHDTFGKYEIFHRKNGYRHFFNPQTPIKVWRTSDRNDGLTFSKPSSRRYTDPKAFNDGHRIHAKYEWNSTKKWWKIYIENHYPN